ncbi:MAG: trigger factor [Deltaproteobacteria bacterium]|nr:trigger factor [Deltaproteobacteria bacterium]
MEVSPTIEPKDYKGLAVKRQKVQVADRAVEDRLKRMAEMRAQLRTIEEQRPAKDGDIVEVTFEGTIDGEPFEGGKGENQLLELGSGSFIPGFEDGVKGLGAGEEKDLDLTFPEDYGHKPLAGKAARFHVTLGAIKERVIPALDDEFAKDVSAELASLDELRARERESLRGGSRAPRAAFRPRRGREGAARGQ